MFSSWLADQDKLHAPRLLLKKYPTLSIIIFSMTVIHFLGAFANFVRCTVLYKQLFSFTYYN